MNTVETEYQDLKRQKYEEKLDVLHGLELLYDKIKLNRSALHLEGKLQDESHAMADKSFQGDMLRVKTQIDKIKVELTDQL